MLVPGHKQQEHTAAGDRVILPNLLLLSNTACIAFSPLPQIVLSRWDNKALHGDGLSGLHLLVW